MDHGIKPYSVGEEIANAVVHGLGWLLSIGGLVILIILSGLYGNAWHVVSSAIYGTGLILMYTSSTMYHSLTNPSAKNRSRSVLRNLIVLRQGPNRQCGTSLRSILLRSVVGLNRK